MAAKIVSKTSARTSVLSLMVVAAGGGRGRGSSCGCWRTSKLLGKLGGLAKLSGRATDCAGPSRRTASGRRSRWLELQRRMVRRLDDRRGRQRQRLRWAERRLGLGPRQLRRRRLADYLPLLRSLVRLREVDGRFFFRRSIG